MFFKCIISVDTSWYSWISKQSKKVKEVNWFELLLLVCRKKNLFNPFHANVVFLHSRKTPESLWFSDVLRGYRNGTQTWNGLIWISLPPYQIQTITRKSRKPVRLEYITDPKNWENFVIFLLWYSLYCETTELPSHFITDKANIAQSAIQELDFVWPIFAQCSISIPPENVKKPLALTLSGGIEMKH